MNPAGNEARFPACGGHNLQVLGLFMPQCHRIACPPYLPDRSFLPAHRTDTMAAGSLVGGPGTSDPDDPPGQGQRLAVHEVHVRAEALVDGGELDADVARAHDQHAVPRQLVQHQRVVGRDRMLLCGPQVTLRRTCCQPADLPVPPPNVPQVQGKDSTVASAARTSPYPAQTQVCCASPRRGWAP